MNILSFSGFVPEAICDTVRFIHYEGDKGISHYCGYASDFISWVLNDPEIDGALFPRTCDSSRAMASYLEGRGKFLFQLHVPARRDEAAVDVLRSSLLRYKESVEHHYGVVITDQEVRERAALVNERNRKLAALYEDLAEIPYGAYLEMVHGLLRKPLQVQAAEIGSVDLRNLQETTGGEVIGGKRVYLVGSLLCDTDITRTIEASGMKIVGDRLTESKRLFTAPEIKLTGDIYGGIARSMLGSPVSPTQNDFAGILREDMEEIRRKGIGGVIFINQKYCEPYDYLYPVYEEALSGMGIPTLRLTLSNSTDGRKHEAAIEAFSDIL